MLVTVQVLSAVCLPVRCKLDTSISHSYRFVPETCTSFTSYIWHITSADLARNL